METNLKVNFETVVLTQRTKRTEIFIKLNKIKDKPKRKSKIKSSTKSNVRKRGLKIKTLSPEDNLLYLNKQLEELDRLTRSL